MKRVSEGILSIFSLQETCKMIVNLRKQYSVVNNSFTGFLMGVSWLLRASGVVGKGGLKKSQKLKFQEAVLTFEPFQLP